MKASYERASRSRADLRNRAQQGYHQAMSEYMKKKIECREKGMSKEEEMVAMKAERNQLGSWLLEKRVAEKNATMRP